MSDDTPTQRFDADGGDAPTEILATPAGDEAAPLVAEERKNRRLIIILASIGGALLLAVLIVLILLLTRDNGGPSPVPTASQSPSSSASPTPSASATPTATPSATATSAPPPPPDNTLRIEKFTGTSTVSCNTEAPITFEYPVNFEWKTSGADRVYFGVQTADASLEPLFTNLPANGTSQNDFQYQQFFPCARADQNYTLTVVDDDGNKISKNIIITNVGDTQ